MRRPGAVARQRPRHMLAHDAQPVGLVRRVEVGQRVRHVLLAADEVLFPAHLAIRAGAVPNEKIPWGKPGVDTPSHIIESDASIVAPRSPAAPREVGDRRQRRARAAEPQQFRSIRLVDRLQRLRHRCPMIGIDRTRRGRSVGIADGFVHDRFHRHIDLYALTDFLACRGREKAVDLGQFGRTEIGAVQVADPAMIVWQRADDKAFEHGFKLSHDRVDQPGMFGFERLDRGILEQRRPELGPEQVDPRPDLQFLRVQQLREPQALRLALVEVGGR